MLEGYVAGYRQGDLGPTLEQQGRVLRRLEQPHVRRYVSVFGWFAEQIRSRNSKHSKPVVCLMDGDRALWEKVKGLMEVSGFAFRIFMNKNLCPSAMSMFDFSAVLPLLQGCDGVFAACMGVLRE